MRIGISLLNFKPGAVGGIETYIRKMVELSGGLCGGDQVVFFVHSANRHVLPDGAEFAELPWSQVQVDAARILEAFTPWRARALERLVEESGVEVMLFTQQSMFPKVTRIPSALLVADVQYLFSPQYYSRFDLAFRKRAYIGSLSRCSRIISISGVTARHLTEHCGVPSRKIDVIHLGFDPGKAAEGDLSVVPDVPYLYYPAVTYPHKGHAVLFRSFAALKRTGRIPHKLVLSGATNRYWNVLQKIIREEGIETDVLHRGYVTYGQVRALYDGADAVLFPTEFEGFGMPALEAVFLKKKLICSALPIFDELGVPREWQIDFSDPEQLLNALNRPGPTRLLKEPICWDEVVRRNLDIVRRTGKGCFHE
jgi:glycosyltransferase involved in cell wall biosynthesis